MEYVYAALLLHKAGKPIDEEHMKKVLASVGAHVDEARVKVLLASLAGVDINKELENASVMAVAAPSSSGASEKKEEKEEVKTEAAAEGLSALFG